MNKRLGFIIDPVEKVKIKKDSSVAIIEEAQRRGHSCFVMYLNDLYIADGVAKANAKAIKVNLKNTPWYDLSAATNIDLADLDIIFMRKDPPFDMEYIFATYILDLAELAGTIVVNKPQSLRDANEKVFTSLFPKVTPPAVITRNKSLIHEFAKQHDKIILKPLDGMGGKSIFVSHKDDLNLNVITEILTHDETRYAMVQKFIPEVKQGDKRVLLINGEAIPYGLARIPAENDIRGNLAQGATGKPVKLNQRDFEICDHIAPTLKKMGLYFVGIDIIGDYLTEINVTSPTCIREIDAAFETNISATLLDQLQNLA